MPLSSALRLLLETSLGTILKSVRESGAVVRSAVFRWVFHKKSSWDHPLEVRDGREERAELARLDCPKCLECLESLKCSHCLECLENLV